MKARRLFSLLLCIILCFSALAGCGGTKSSSNASPATAPAAAETGKPPEAATTQSTTSQAAAAESSEVDWSTAPKILIKVGTGFSADALAPLAAALEYVKEQTQGTVDYEIYPNGTLINDSEAIDGVYDNIVQMGHSSSGNISGYIPEVGCLAIPGYCGGTQEDHYAFYEFIRPIMIEIFESYNLRFYSNSYVGKAGFICSKKQIESPSDLNGMIIRTSGGVMSDVVSAWGAAPAVIAMGDVPTALERHTVDGAYTAYITFGTMKWCEMADYVTETGMLESSAMDFMNMDVYNSMIPEQQKAWNDSVKIFLEQGYELYLDDYNEANDIMKETGTNVVVLSDEQNKEFTDISTTLFEEWGKTASPLGLKLLAAVYEWNGWEWPF